MTTPIARAGAEVQFRATGVESVRRGTREVTAAADQMTQRMGGASRQIAGGVEMIARTGRVTGEALKQIVAQGAEMAFMFGKAGPVVGAIGILGVAAYGVFQRIRDESEKTRKKVREDMEALANAGDFQGMREQLRDLEQGTPGKRYEDGINARQTRLAGLRARLGDRADAATWNPVLRGQINRQIRELETGLRPDLERRDMLMEQILNPAAPRRTTGMLPAVSVTADSPNKKPSTPKQLKDLASLYSVPGVDTILAGVAEAWNRRSLEQNADATLKENSPGAIVQRELTASIAAGVNAAAGSVPAVVRGFTPLGEAIQDTVQQGVANAIVGGISAGVEEAVRTGDLGSGLKALTGNVLSAIGGMFQQVGAQVLVGLQFMQAIKTAIMAWNPAVGMAAAVGLIAFGALLQGAGAGMGGGGGRGSSGGYGGGFAGSGTQVIDRGMINPLNPMQGITPRAQNQYNLTVIGERDPVAQRTLARMVNAGNKKGA